MGKNFVDTKLKRAIRKHGADKFRIEQLRSDARSYKERMEQEKAEISRRETYRNGYNSTLGGELVFNPHPSRSVTANFRPHSRRRVYGIDETAIRSRIDALKWTPEQAVSLVQRERSKYCRKR